MEKGSKSSNQSPIHNRNLYKGGVDVSDQMIALYEFDRRIYKWWKRILFHLFDVAIVNSYLIY